MSAADPPRPSVQYSPDGAYWWDGHAWQPVQAAQSAGRPPAMGECQTCGHTPARPFHFRTHRGLVLLMMFGASRGVWCRDCALAVWRHCQNKTLLQGWWGLISYFATWATLGYNLIQLASITALGPPQPTPGVIARRSAPIPPGEPLWRRPGFWVGAAVGVATLVVVAGLITGQVAAVP